SFHRPAPLSVSTLCGVARSLWRLSGTLLVMELLQTLHAWTSLTGCTTEEETRTCCNRDMFRRRCSLTVWQPLLQVATLQAVKSHQKASSWNNWLLFHCTGAGQEP
ncbi:hypothetical protein KUCAC02_030668, partial [Chaenocephalus aceratus]